MAIPLSIHLISAIIWIGGMFFANWMLRPAVENLDLPAKVRLWIDVLERFFSWIWVIVFTQPATGYWMVFYELGGFHHAGMHIFLMQIVGLFMIFVFFWVYFVLFKNMKRMAKEELFPEAGMYMMKIRRMVLLNLTLGSMVSTLAVVGRFL
ncbi:MAG: uncharacterized protein HW380_3957 [Magnetococcales bacterium]|nr:uncharacterized protein [Magnetococcales bacterium]HIJ82612.1 hypothetical protein [Magnetococcales bacterium]